MRWQRERGRKNILPAKRALQVGEWCKARERVQAVRTVVRRLGEKGLLNVGVRC